MKERVYDEINKAFRPEFLNRLSEEPVIFRHLEKQDLKLVIDFELSKIRERLGERGLPTGTDRRCQGVLDQERYQS